MNIFSVFTRAYSSWKTASALNKLDSCRLNDLGLTAYDVMESRKLGHSHRAQFFNMRRSERAQSVLR